MLSIYKAEIKTDEVAGVFFCGGGGSTDGIVRYTTIPVVGAVNHDLAAIRMHQTNHPFTEHYKEDVFAVDPKNFCNGYPMGFAWFSPDCTHFSRARGGTPVKKEIRGLSWVIVKWALSVRPRVMVMENVPEIRTWGPLVDKGGKKYPDQSRAGETFDGFIKIMTSGIEASHPALLECCDFLNISPDGSDAQKLIRGLGYSMEWKELCAADYGVHTTRTRFFGIFRCDGNPIIWPKQTHGKRGSKDVMDGIHKPWRPAYEILDFNIPAPSIFATKEEIKQKYSIRAVRPLRDNTLRRIARGLDKFVLKIDTPFVIESKQHSQSSHTPYLAQYHTERTEHVRGQCVDEPIMTLDASNRYGVVCPILTKYYGNDDHGQDICDPLHTVTAKDREGLIILGAKQISDIQPLRYLSETMMVTSIRNSVEYGRWACVREILNRWAGYAIGETELLLKKINGEWYYIEDIGLRMLKAKEAYQAMGFAKDYVFDVDFDGRKMTAKEQMEKCGNAVCPDIAGLIAASNLPEYAREDVCRSMAEWRKTIVA